MGKKYSDKKDYKVIAVVLARFSLEDQQNMIKTIARKSAEHNCKVVFFSTLTNFYKTELDANEVRIFDIVSVEQFDAIVFMAETFKSEVGQQEFVRRATKAGVPVIAVDHFVPGCINISFDYKESFREIVKHMVEFHGYRDVNFIAGMPDNSFSNERIEVFKSVLEENDIPFDYNRVYYGHFWEVPTAEAMDKMLENNARLPEAIICANDTMALTVCSYLNKRGIRVPEDVAVSGFDGIEVGKYHQPQLLTSVYDGDAFADALFQLINGKECIPGEKELMVSAYNRMQIGGSCGCPGIAGLDATEKIIKVQTDMNKQMEYQVNLGRMVANYGEREGIDIVQTVIPDQLKYMNYHDFWLCSEKRILFADYDGFADNHQEMAGTYNAIHYEKTEKVTVDYIEHTPIHELVPNMEKHLEAEYPLLVVAAPNQEDFNAYSVISMDTENFLYASYAGFIFHLRFLLDMQHSKKMLMQVYRTDALTGVLNRNGFYSTMGQIMEFSKITELTVISLDMCEFKQINDTYGHAEGDIALKAVGRIIRESVTHREITARIGGDEFLIVLFRENQKQRTEEIITSISKKAEEFNEKNEKNYRLIFSIGVCSEAMENHTLDYFLRKADKQMYAHKKEQKLGR